MLEFDPFPGDIPDDPAEIMRLLNTLEGKRYPHALYDRLREVAPMYHDPQTGVMFVSRWKDVDELFRSPRFGGQEGRLQADPRFDSSPALQLIAANVSFRDPPEVIRLRGYAQRALSRPVIEGVRAYLETLTAEVLDGLAERDSFDIVSDYAVRIPPTVICHMLGIPVADRQKFEGWVADQFRLLTPTPVSDEVLAEVNATSLQLKDYVSGLIEERRLDPRNDLISGLLQATDLDGKTMTPHELIAMTLVLLAGGSDTTRFVIAMGARALLLDREMGDKLRADPSLDSKAFEEFTRLYGPVAIGNIRRSAEDTELGGVTIPAGMWCAPVIAGANLDPTVFKQPRQLDIARHPNPHLSFGGGVHSCLGMMMARMIGPYAIGAFARRFSNLEVVDRTIDINPHLFSLRGLQSLPVRKI